MKKRLYLIFFIIAILTIPLINIKAEKYTEFGSQGGGNVGSGCTKKDGSLADSCWPDSSSGTGKATDGFRISLYKFKDDKITKIGESYDFINDKKQVDSLKGDSGITYISQKTGKIDYLSGTSFTTAKNSSFGSNLYYLNFSNFLSGNVDLNIIKILNDTKDTIIKKYEDLINKYIDSDAKYYFVFEPVTIIIYNYNKSNKVYFYGTLYEHIRYLIGTTGNYNTFNAKANWQQSTLLTVLPTSLRVTSADTKNNADFIKFINKNFAYKLADLNNIAHMVKNNNGSVKYLNNKPLYKPEVINTYTYGMYVVDAETTSINIIRYKNESCKTNIDVNSCKNIGISEPTSKVCVVNDNTYFYGNYNETTSIYCSDSVQTSFNEFYTTFRKSIRAGSYFNMNPLKVTDTKTCYINNISNSASGWQNSINTSKNIGTIDLSIGNFSYKLIGATTSSNVTCNSYSGGVCTKATVVNELAYNLNPLVNRFINIKTMKQDTCADSCINGTNDIKTCIANCKNINTNIDKGTSNLTVPLNYLNGVYKYNLKFDNSIILTVALRNHKNGKEEIKRVDNQSYKITYDVAYNVDSNKNNSISNNNLSFTCPYKVTKYQCKDDDGNYYPCDDPKCTGNNCDSGCENENCGECENLGTNECCINGKKTACPSACNYECCDANGNEISCPGGDSIIGDVIYRPISLVEPFPGKDGNKRTPGNNWNKIVKTADGKVYSYGDYYIRLRRGYKDYEIYQTEPLYVIKLDGNKIQAIRKYNDKHDYNDFELTCINGENCVSNFLRGATQDFSINLIDSGTCKNINSHNFDSCIKNKGLSKSPF